MEGYGSSRCISRGVHSLRGSRMATLHESTNGSVENDRRGRRSPTGDWSHYLSLPFFSSNPTLAERRSAGFAKRIKERLNIFVWTTCSKSWRTGIRWLHSRFSSSARGDFLCSDDLNALSP